MEFGGRLSRTAFADLIDRKHDRIRRVAGALPLHGIADWPGTGLIGSWDWTNDVLTYAGLRYQSSTGMAWAEVAVTTGSASDFAAEQRTAAALGSTDVHDDESFQRVLDAVEAVLPSEVAIGVDGAPRLFRHWAGAEVSGWCAALEGTPGLVVTAFGLEPHDIRLVPVPDVEPYLAETRAMLLAGYDSAEPR